VRKAVHTVLHDPSHRDAAQRIAASMARSPGITQLAEIVDTLSERDTT
jgi:UDP:flavonoid glycosyltransferase YjiC (YdhE family)